MQFADNSMQTLPPVSLEAMNLINCLLARKEVRLCSKKYRDNEPRSRIRSHLQTTRPNAYFVFENDASGIKRHPFFADVNWDQLLAQVPPFIPRIMKNDHIAMYFDDEKDILGSYTGTTLRARDKVLRDPEHGSTALEVRKQCAFLGYTYRRPRY
jgi:protein-serine/threonine kinase